jgi:hypothetical protein
VFVFLYAKYQERENKRARERVSARDRTEADTESLRGREGERERKVIRLYFEHIIEIER